MLPTVKDRVIFYLMIWAVPAPSTVSLIVLATKGNGEVTTVVIAKTLAYPVPLIMTIPVNKQYIY